MFFLIMNKFFKWYIFIYRGKLIGGRDLGERTQNSKIIFIISLDFPSLIFILNSKFWFHSLGTYSGNLGLLQKKKPWCI